MGIVRYFYRREPISANRQRIVTVSYVHDRETGETVYGASMFRQDQPNEQFVKSQHRHTADERRTKCPVKVSVTGQNWDAIEDGIREAIRTYGVKGDRQLI